MYYQRINLFEEENVKERIENVHRTVYDRASLIHSTI